MPAIVTATALIIAGAAQTLSLNPFNLWPLVFLSIALAVTATRLLDPSQSLGPRKAFLYGWLIGFGLYASGASWIYVSINSYGNAPPLLAGSLTFLFVSGLAVFQGLCFCLFSKLRSQKILLNAGLFSALWTLTDLFRSLFLTGFPWLFIGDTQTDGPLKALLPVLGVYGVTFIICFSSAGAIAALSALRKHQNQIVYSYLFILALVVTSLIPLSYAQWTDRTAKELSVALVQLNIPQELKWQRSQREKTIRLLQQSAEDHKDADLIVWPETALPILFDRAKPLLDSINTKAATENTSIITGIPYRGWSETHSSNVMHNSIIGLGKANGIYHKQKLVPFGEYVPLQDVLRGLIDFFDLPMSDFRKGPSDQALLNVGDLKVSPFICYEIVYPDFVASRARDADVLLTISNDSWFGQSIGPHQHLQIARTRAIENGRFMIRATNNGVTAIIDEHGNITTEIPQFERATLKGKVSVVKGMTPYTSWGSIPTVLVCLLIIMCAFFDRKRPSSK